MNPNFALDFRNDKIKLLHVQEGVWVQIGVVAVEDPDLDAALGYLRSTALGLSPRGIASKLILPDAAILYTTLPNLSLDADTRATEIALALVGRTPYDVADLVYDWVDDGSKAHLAVIARETLDEAEVFANQHRFNPVAFGGWPEQGQFPTEADFGRSANMAHVIAPIDSPLPQTSAVALSASDFEMGDAAVNDVAGDNIAVDQTALDDPAPLSVPPGNDLPFVPTEDVVDPSDIVINSEETADTTPAFDDAPFDAIVDQDLADFQQMADAEIAAFDDVQPDLTEPDLFEPDLAKVDLAEPDPSVTAQPDLFSPAPSFAAIMAQEADEAPMALDVPVEENVHDNPAPIAIPVVGASASPSSGKAQSLLAEFAARRDAALGKADSGGRVEPKLSAEKNAGPTVPFVSPDIRAEAVAKIGAAGPQKPLRKSEVGLGSKPSVKRPATKARGSNSAVMGFVLTILLLIALAAAAALSSYLTTAWNSFGASTALAARQPLQEAKTDMLAFGPSSIAPISPARINTAPISPAPLTAELLVPSSLPVPVTLPMPSLVSESSSSLVPLATPAALPQPIVVAPPNIITTSADRPAAAPITPTAQGVLTPEGVFLIAGRPSVLPLARPASVVAAALQRPAVADAAPPNSAAFADPALAGKKPALRPADLAPQIAEAVIQSDPALAGKRPLARTETVLAAANSAQIALASLAQAELDAPRSTMAVTISRLPAARPRNLDTTPAAPQILAAPEQIIPEDIAPEVVASNVPLEADNEPEVINPKSTGPRTVVSQNATFKNAINLSKINLIGVYGSQANRYALIRQSNGRFKKVYVGDRFDGGLVAAITERELRYSKAGQMLALEMPNG